MQKTKIQGILPLNFMQQALLFHSLSSEKDQGFLHVECILNGPLDKDQFQKAWEAVVKRHEIFRISIHWEKLEKPLQVIHPNALVEIAYEDWTNLTAAAQATQLSQYKTADREQGLSLSQAPVYRLALFQIAADKHLFIWTCHHILLDGWSASNVIKDVFEFYEGAINKSPVVLDAVPPFKAYIKEFQAIDKQIAESFWKEHMKGFEQPSLLKEQHGKKEQAYAFESKIVDQTLSTALKAIAKQNRITLNTLIQGIWSALLAKHTGKEDVVFGTTLSVRSNELENADLMAGLFTNMLPVRVKIEKGLPFVQWLANIQEEQTKVRNHQHVSLHQILSWKDWPGYLPLFDHLLVIENFPWKDFSKGGVRVQGFKSGITTTYPMTLIVKPLETIEFIFQYDTQHLSKSLIDWLLGSLEILIPKLIAHPQQSIESLLKGVEAWEAEEMNAHGARDAKELEGPTGASREFVAPSSPLELDLIKIWEEVFGRSDISVTDNFFEIGGKSILAIRLFAKIKNELGYKLPPITLLQHPSIRAIAQVLDKEGTDTAWKSLVPIQTSGDKTPVFCLHAKGGYVFFYNPLAKYLEKDQPIYALQPRGLDGVEPFYKNIEEMAASYIEEIQTIQPEGPYTLLAACFSNAVGFEMAQQLKKQGQEIGLLMMVDASPGKSLSDIEAANSGSLLNKISQKVKQNPLRKQGAKAYRALKTVLKNNAESSLTEEEQQLLKMERIMDKIFVEYERKPYDGKITLVRSSEYSVRADKDFHVQEWKRWVKEGNLDVVIVEGKHKTMFVEPEVQLLAKEVNKCLTNRKA